MTEPARMEIADAPMDTSTEFDARIASMRTAGAEQFDPMRWHYIEALAKRAAAHHGSVKQMIDARLAQALTVYQERFDLAQSEAKEAIAQSAQQYPHVADHLQRLFAGGDFKALHRLIATLHTNEQSASLGALVRQLDQHAQHAPENTDAKKTVVRPDAHAGSPPELKTIRNFRNTWSKLSVDKQVAKALEKAPKNAGPINSHMLVLRSLAMMRDISPDYLNRFMSYTETLLNLDQGEKDKVVKDKAAKDKPGNPKKPQVAKAAKK